MTTQESERWMELFIKALPILKETIKEMKKRDKVG